MGRAKIISGGTAGLYTIEPDYDMAKFENETAIINSTLQAIETALANNQTDLDDWDYNIGMVEDELALIPAWKLDRSTQYFDEDAWEEYSEYMVDLRDFQREKKYTETLGQTLKILKAEFTKKKEVMDALQARIETGVEAWCADYTVDLQPDDVVATVEVPGELFENVIQIRPAYTDNATYNGDRDGQLTPLLGTSPAGTVYNLAMLPGRQRWKPQYRYGELLHISPYNEAATPTQLGKVQLLSHYSSQQSINVNQKEYYLQDVPCEYMECDYGAFEVGDIVLVEFAGRDWTQPKVIGFRDNPRRCQYTVIAMVETALHHNWNDSATDPWDRGQTSVFMDITDTYAMAWDVLKNQPLALPGVQSNPGLLSDITSSFEDQVGSPLEDFRAGGLDLWHNDTPPIFSNQSPPPPGDPDWWWDAWQLVPRTDAGFTYREGEEGSTVITYPWSEWDPDGPEYHSSGGTALLSWGTGTKIFQHITWPWGTDPRDWESWGDVPYDAGKMYHKNMVYNNQTTAQGGNHWPGAPSKAGGMTRGLMNRGYFLQGINNADPIDWDKALPGSYHTLYWANDGTVSNWGIYSEDHHSEDEHDQEFWWFGAKRWIWPWYKDCDGDGVPDQYVDTDCDGVPDQPLESLDWPDNICTGARYDSDNQISATFGFEISMKSAAYHLLYDPPVAFGHGSGDYSSIDPSKKLYFLSRSGWRIDQPYYGSGYTWKGAGTYTAKDWYRPLRIRFAFDSSTRSFNLNYNMQVTGGTFSTKTKYHACVVPGCVDFGTCVGGLGYYITSQWAEMEYSADLIQKLNFYSEEDPNSPLNTPQITLWNPMRGAYSLANEDPREAAVPAYQGGDSGSAESFRPSWSEGGEYDSSLPWIGTGVSGSCVWEGFNTRHFSEGYYFDWEQTPSQLVKCQIGFSIIGQGKSTMSFDDITDMSPYAAQYPGGQTKPAIATEWNMEPLTFYIEAVSREIEEGTNANEPNPFVDEGGINTSFAEWIKNLMDFAYLHGADNKPGFEMAADTPKDQYKGLYYEATRWVPTWDLKFYIVPKNIAIW